MTYLVAQFDASALLVDWIGLLPDINHGRIKTGQASRIIVDALAFLLAVAIR